MLLDNCTVVTMDAERRILRDAAIVVQGNSIAAVGKSSEIRPRFPEDTVRDLHGWVVTPGLVDGHIHLPQAILRGCGDEVPLWVWMAERIFILEGAFTAEDARISMRLAASRLAGAATITFQFAEHARTTVHVRPGRPQLLRVPLCAAKNARVTYRSKKVTLVGVRAVTVRATAPVFTPSPSACSALG